MSLSGWPIACNVEWLVEDTEEANVSSGQEQLPHPCAETFQWCCTLFVKRNWYQEYHKSANHITLPCCCSQYLRKQLCSRNGWRVWLLLLHMLALMISMLCFFSSNQCLCVHVCMYRCSLDPFYIENSGDQLRIRASVFINLVAMRSCISRSRNTSCILEPSNVSVLNRSNFLVHCALNCYLVHWNAENISKHVQWCHKCIVELQHVSATCLENKSKGWLEKQSTMNAFCGKSVQKFIRSLTTFTNVRPSFMFRDV